MASQHAEAKDKALEDMPGRLGYLPVTPGCGRAWLWGKRRLMDIIIYILFKIIGEVYGHFLQTCSCQA